MFEFCSCFYKDNAYFGGYPSKEQFIQLKEKGFEIFVDLTTIKEKNSFEFIYNFDTVFQNSQLNYINYSIIDNKIPNDTLMFLQILEKLKIYIEDGKKVYLHCKGGHGRSSLVVCCLLILLNNNNDDKKIQNVFQLTKELHKKRKNLKKKYLNIDCPQVSMQKQFVLKFQESYFKKEDDNNHKDIYR